MWQNNLKCERNYLKKVNEMVKIGQQIETSKGKGIVRQMWKGIDDRWILEIENKNKHYFQAIEGDDFN